MIGVANRRVAAPGHVHFRKPVFSGDLNGVIGDYLLSDAPRSRANVALHVVSGPAGHPAVDHLDPLVHSTLAIASDVADHDGVRGKSEAIRCLAHGTVAGSDAVH